jgi:osmotically-inducible protein OsmY
MVPDDLITVTVDNGWVMLEGNVDWQCQRAAAEHAVRHLIGVKAVMNAIRVRTTVSPSDVKHQLFDAFRRSAELEARRIGVDVHDGKLTLHGNVQTWAEVEEAQRAAWCVPGVTDVDNQLKVVP